MNTETDVTGKATSMTHTENGGKSSSSASNKGKQNKGEKHVVFCVSIKICHLTHFTRLAYKDTNEVMKWLSAISLIGMQIRHLVGVQPQHHQLIWYLIHKPIHALNRFQILLKSLIWVHGQNLSPWDLHQWSQVWRHQMMMTSMYLWQEQYLLIYFLSLHTVPLVGPTCSFDLISIIVEYLFQTWQDVGNRTE